MENPLEDLTKSYFRVVWERLSTQGFCDTVDSMEYERVLLLYLNDRDALLPTEAFIKRHANQTAWESN